MWRTAALRPGHTTTMPFDVRLIIPNSVIANELCALAHAISWEPAVDGKPAEGTFTFDTEGSRKHFLDVALAMRGVRIVAETK